MGTCLSRCSYCVNHIGFAYSLSWPVRHSPAVVGGDAFEAVPGGGAAYVFSNFLVVWEDDRAVRPLRNCRKAIAGDGTVLLVEWVMPTGDEPQEGFRFWDTVTRDLLMFSILGKGNGRVRTRAGFRELLAAAGFKLTAVIPTRGSVSVIEAKPSD